MSEEKLTPESHAAAADAWAAPVAALSIDEMPAGATDLNLAGRALANPLDGFGPLWQRTYRVRLAGATATPEQVIAAWKANFARFQPPENRFLATADGVAPGELLFIDSVLTQTPGIRQMTPMASGVLVMYADATVGFPVAGWNTFSAYDDDGVTVAQVQVLDRTSDPIYEFGYRFMGGETKQDGTWTHVLRALAAHFGVSGEVMMQKTCIDDRLQWRNARNAWYNASIRTFFHRLTHPFQAGSQPPPMPARSAAQARSVAVAPPPAAARSSTAGAVESSPPSAPAGGVWAKPVQRLDVKPLAAEAINLNVQGKSLTGPLKGFGQMWQKTFSVRLTGVDVTPAELVRMWKANFPSFWPSGNRFFGSLEGIAPGEVAVLNLSGPGGAMISTGVLVIYADDESFSFMTPQGHVFAGMITFSAHDDEGVTVANIQMLIRASDPLFEAGCRIGIVHRMEDQFWHGTLRNLAAYYGLQGQVVQRTTLVDPRMQWSEAGAVWHNAAVRTTLYAPVNAAKSLLRRA